jgi:hypothetical protein
MDAQMKRYRGERRRGVRGRVGLFRGVVVVEPDDEVIQARSPRLAAVIAQLLNGDELPPTQVEDRSPVPAYAVTHGGGSDEQYFVVGVQSTARKPSRFGDGLIARTVDRSTAAEVVRKLNEIDPRARPRVTRGMAWW